LVSHEYQRGLTPNPVDTMRYHFNQKSKEYNKLAEDKFRKMRPTTYGQSWGGTQSYTKITNKWPTLNTMQLHEKRGMFPGSECKQKTEKCP